jgi:hypothetical protein
MQMTIPLKRWQVRQDSKNDFCGFRCVIRPILKMFKLKSFFTLIRILVSSIRDGFMFPDNEYLSLCENVLSDFVCELLIPVNRVLEDTVTRWMES